MRNVGAITALTVSVVLVASGAAGALNSRVLRDASSPVGTAESFLPGDEPSAPPLTPATGPTGSAQEPGPGPSTPAGEGQGTDASSEPPEASSGDEGTRPASTRPTTTSRTAASVPRPRTSTTHHSSASPDDGRGGSSHAGGPEPEPGEPDD